MFSLFSFSVFAWESYEHGSDVHPLADPTKLELMHSEFKKKKDVFKGDQQQSILEKYGGEEHLDAPPKALLLAQTVKLPHYPVFTSHHTAISVCTGGVCGVLSTGECRERPRERSGQVEVRRGCGHQQSHLCMGLLLE